MGDKLDDSELWVSDTEGEWGDDDDESPDDPRYFRLELGRAGQSGGIVSVMSDRTRTSTLI